MYGYANKKETKQNHAMLRALRKEVEKFKKDNPFATVLIGGDINADVDTHLDTRGATQTHEAGTEAGNKLQPDASIRARSPLQE